MVIKWTETYQRIKDIKKITKHFLLKYWYKFIVLYNENQQIIDMKLCDN